MILKRTINTINITLSYCISRILKRSFHYGMPLAISVEPTTSCNLHCPECPTGLRTLTRPMGRMSFADFKRILDPFLPQLTYLTLYFQGEPYLNPELFEMIRYARARKVYVATSTNAHYLNEEQARETILSGLNKLIISLDGADDTSYKQYRIGGDFQRVLEGIRNLAAMKRLLGRKNPKTILQCLYLRSNQNQMDEIRALAKELGADRLEFKTAQILDPGADNPILPENPKHNRYFNHSKNQKLINSCFRMWSSCVVTWDGKVVPCCFDKDASYILGDLRKDDIKTIWRSREYIDFRNRVLIERNNMDICRNCSQRF